MSNKKTPHSTEHFVWTRGGVAGRLLCCGVDPLSIWATTLHTIHVSHMHVNTLIRRKVRKGSETTFLTSNCCR